MKLSDLAQQLREQADHLESLENELRVPPTEEADLSIADAAARLFAAKGKPFEFSIRAELTFGKDYSSDLRDCRCTGRRWTIQVTYKDYHGPTLADAVRGAMDVLRPVPPEVVKEVENALAGKEPEPAIPY